MPSSHSRSACFRASSCARRRNRASSACWCNRCVRASSSSALSAACWASRAFCFASSSTIFLFFSSSCCSLACSSESSSRCFACCCVSYCCSNSAKRRLAGEASVGFSERVASFFLFMSSFLVTIMLPSEFMFASILIAAFVSSADESASSHFSSSFCFKRSCSFRNSCLLCSCRCSRSNNCCCLYSSSRRHWFRYCSGKFTAYWLHKKSFLATNNRTLAWLFGPYRGFSVTGSISNKRLRNFSTFD
mmetsp:Transcript_2035/g.4786  ORF Transcript_2035/g.4786 Transcript_2035/m.4786 type:complete len:247 (+) Transcript_2035:1351-2091(+)